MEDALDGVSEEIVLVMRIRVRREWEDRDPGDAIVARKQFSLKFSGDRPLVGRTEEGMRFDEDPGLGPGDERISEGVAVANRSLHIGLEDGRVQQRQSNQRAMLVLDDRDGDFRFGADPGVD